MPRSNTAGAVVGIAGLLSVIGAFLPWASFQGVNFSGTHELIGDGWITLVLGVVALILAVLIYTQGARRWHGIVALIAGAIILFLTIIDVIDTGEVSIGIGLWMTLVAGLLAAVGGIMAIRGGAQGATMAPPPPPPPPAA